MKESLLLFRENVMFFLLCWTALIIFLSCGCFHEPISGFGMVSSIFGTALLFLGLSKCKWVGYWVIPLLFALIGIHYFIIEEWELKITYDLIASIFETNTSEAAMYFTWENISITTLTLFAGVGLCYLLRRKVLTHVNCYGWISLSILFLLSGSLALHFPANPKKAYEEILSPISKLYGYIDTIEEYLLKHGENYGMLENLPKSSASPSSCSEKDDLVLIFQFGESVMASHLPMNGYERNTMPRLSALPKENLVSYPKTESYACLTRRCAVGMLTDAELRDRKPKHSSFIDLFNKHGYQTSRFIGANESQWDFTLFLLTNAAQHTMNTDYVEAKHCRFDDTILVVRNELKARPDGKKLIVLYNSGAHIPFHHTPTLAQFFPTDNKDLESRANSYDNALIDIDYMIAEIIHSLQDKNAVYFFFSDHGMEKKFATGGRFQAPVKKPACFIWMSDKYIATHPEIAKTLHANTSKKISHDHLFHTILSIGGISSQIQKETLDLTKPTAIANPDELFYPNDSDD